MSRNTDYQFVPTDAESVEAQLVSYYEKLTGASLQPADPMRLLFKTVAYVIVLERADTNYTGNQNIPSRAAGANLDTLAELFNVSGRPDAQPAVCTERFYISEAQESAILIPAGTRVTDTSSTLVWETVADAYVSIGETYVDVQIRCQTPGTAGNGYTPGQINTFVDLYDYCSACENTTTSDDGADAATDEEFYDLMRASMDSYSTAGALGSYIYWAKSVSTEIADVVANSPTPGEVKLYVLMNDGTKGSEEIKKAALAACNAEEHRPLTDHVTTADPEEVSYNITLTYYIQTDAEKSAAAIQADVDAAVKEYVAWQCGRFGRDINPDKLRDYLFSAGVKRVVLTEPEFQMLYTGKEIDEATFQAAHTPQIARGVLLAGVRPAVRRAGPVQQRDPPDGADHHQSDPGHQG